jgi:DNA-directed RNA polymerase specialized sigma24 family protein
MDKEVIIEFINGSERAFGEVYDLYAGKVLRLGRQILPSEELARDFVQDFFVKLDQNTPALLLPGTGAVGGRTLKCWVMSDR